MNYTDPSGYFCPFGTYGGDGGGCRGGSIDDDGTLFSRLGTGLLCAIGIGGAQISTGGLATLLAVDLCIGAIGVKRSFDTSWMR